MENSMYLTCSFELYKDGVFGPCGEQALNHHKNYPLCAECAEIIRGRGLPVYVLNQEASKKIERAINKAEGGAA